MRMQLCVLALACAASLAQAKGSDPAALGKTLTPMGSEMAANADGSIPAWTGGLAGNAGTVDAKGGYSDPYASEKPLFTITAQNLAQYQKFLSPGQVAMFKRYPDTYKMHIYPTHRSANLPKTVLEQSRENVAKTSLADGGNGLHDYVHGIPFPLPTEALEVMWNHMTRYRGGSYERISSSALVRENGATSYVRNQSLINFADTISGLEPGNNTLFMFKSRVLEPARLSGEAVLVHEPIDQVAEPRSAWQYLPGQRRVRRAPMIAYDNSARYSNGLITADNIDGYNGAPDRFDWKLVGKQELYIPYNSYKIGSRDLKYDAVIKPNHVNQDLARYEKHRVWVVEATLKPNARHIYGKRRFYVDEDSWQIAQSDQYDSRGELWRSGELHAIQHYDHGFTYNVLETSYDLIAGRYYAGGLANEETEPMRVGFAAKTDDYTPSDLRRWAK
ncbi:outer membrane lipoprotein-sorting protein [Pseudomonas sp. S04]|uniref:DUF1329 domain-containing protein n=1 Tax=unclassified Pseudomonas TaxID=196821 RepID=UPI00131FC77C|nr:MULTISPECIES: DUF1329 domain-containing protein [unclassified Pseudomonas]QHD02091.1 outer membrane lipoprotein-sorting protein [Pseudomonas sp. S04]QHF34574.1 outer membrane lipoprotein-sorting protein [Pseudomonas sp. S19]